VLEVHEEEQVEAWEEEEAQEAVDEEDLHREADEVEVEVDSEEIEEVEAVPELQVVHLDEVEVEDSKVEKFRDERDFMTSTSY
jgi:hypothetical protein